MRVILFLLLLAPATGDCQVWRNVAAQAKNPGYALQPIGDFHGDEASLEDGSDWFALRCGESCSVVMVRAAVAAEFDPLLDSEDEATGRRVRARGVPDALYLMRGTRLSRGTVLRSTVEESTGTNGDEEAPMTTRLVLGSKDLLIRRVVETAGGEVARVRVLLERGGHSQILAESDSTDLIGYVLWSGDLDRDGEIDLVVDLSDHYNMSVPTLLLSSEAIGSDLVAAVATHVSTGC